MVSNSDRDDVIEKLAILVSNMIDTRHLRILYVPFFYQIAASVLTENYFMEESEIG